MTLNEVKVSKTVKVINIYCEYALRQRLRDLGLIIGTRITPIFVSPLGNPVAYEFRGNIIAIRNEDAQKINIQ